MSNLKLDDVFSDVFGKSARSITEYILSRPGEHFDVTQFIDKHCKAPLSEIQAAVDGAVSPEQAVKLRQCLDHIDQLQQHRQRLEQEILHIYEPFADILQLLRTVPGFSTEPMTAITVLSELSGDISIFPSAKHLCSWAGCCPRNDQSGGKVKSARISRFGAFLKPLLVQVANALIRSRKHPEFGERYHRIKARRGHKKAIIAVCKMLLTAIWNIWAKLIPYTPIGFLHTPHVDSLSKTPTFSQGLSLLRHRGFVLIDDPAVSVP